MDNFAIWTLEEGYASTRMRGRGGNHMSKGSRNAMATGERLTRAFRGVTARAGVGSRVLFNVDQKFAGLGTAAANGAGAVFKVRDLLTAIGQGAVAYDGALVAGFSASSTLSFVRKSGGVYAAGALTGPFQAGHAQPSAPVIYAKDAPSAGQTPMTGAVSVVIWRVSSITGQVSLMSLPSNVLTLNGQSFILQVPDLPDTNGQDYWGWGAPKIGYADLGTYYKVPTSLMGEFAETALGTVDGHTRAIEVSYTTGALLKELAPDKAFPPPAGQFAGVLNDTVWLDADGVIYPFEPGYLGSAPPSNALFAPEPAVLYMRVADGYLRFGRTTVGVLSYVGGSPSLEYTTLAEGQGIELPQNVAQGEGGRLLVWQGAPAILQPGGALETTFADAVLDEFAGWEAQTSAKPVCPGYHAKGRYEVWAFGKKVMAMYGPTGKWCAPIDLTGLVSGDVVAVVPHEDELLLSCSDGAALTLYRFDVGSGSVMVVQTDDWEGYGNGDTVTEVRASGRADNTSSPVVVQLIKNYDDASPIAISSVNPPATGKQDFARTRPNILNVRTHALRVTMTSQGGDCGIDTLETKGAAMTVFAGV